DTTRPACSPSASMIRCAARLSRCRAPNATTTKTSIRVKGVEPGEASARTGESGARGRSEEPEGQVRSKRATLYRADRPVGRRQIARDSRAGRPGILLRRQPADHAHTDVGANCPP